MEVKGRIIDELSESIGFVHVFNKTNGLGSVADVMGNFKVAADKGDTVQFSYVGYKKLNLVIDNNHLVNFTEVMLPEDPTLLPAVTIYADKYYKVPVNIIGQPMFMEGVTRDEEYKPLNPGKATWGTSPGVGGIPGGGVTINGPITYFSREEREKRKIIVAEEETLETITYQKFIAQDTIRQKLMTLYKLDSSQYDRVILRLNLQNKGIQKAGTPEEIWHWIIRFFNDVVPVMKVYDMTTN